MSGSILVVLTSFDLVVKYLASLEPRAEKNARTDTLKQNGDVHSVAFGLFTYVYSFRSKMPEISSGEFVVFQTCSV